MRYQARVSIAVVSALLAVSAAACTDSSDGSGGNPATVAEPPVVTGTPAIDTLAGLSLPIEAYMMTADQQKTVAAAFVKLVNQCSARFGFTQQVPAPATGRQPLLLFRYGVTDPTLAAQNGYHGVPGAADSADKPPAQATYSPAQQLVLFGAEDGKPRKADNGQDIPQGGCYGEARRKTGRDQVDQADPDSIIVQINKNSMTQSETDARVAGVLTKWSSCMAAKGYQYKTPIGMADNDPELAASFAQPTATQREIQLAVTDVACKKEHNVVGVWYAVEVAYQNVMIQQNQERLTAVRKAIEDAVRTSASIGG